MIDPKIKEEVDLWIKARHRARTDLWYLCTQILNYEDLEPKVHKNIVEGLQKFPGGKDEVDLEAAARGDFKVKYAPACTPWELEGDRFELILDARGFFKTTINTISHSIQWVLNFPDIRVLISTATGDQVKEVMSEILNHFRFNERFRYLFRDYCPPEKSARDWGNIEGATVPNRRRKWMKEPTFSSCSVGKVVAGRHYEVIKNSDLVDKENVKTRTQINNVIQHYGYLNPMLERGPVRCSCKPKEIQKSVRKCKHCGKALPMNRGWMTVEGTRYDFSDLYGTIIENEEKRIKRGRPPQFRIQVQSALLRGDSAKDPNAVARWETRWPLEELRDMEEDPTVGLWMTSAQMYNRPIPSKGGLAKKSQILFVPKEVMRRLRLRIHMTVDLHGLEDKSKVDFTVFNITGFDRDGRMNILEMYRARYTADEVIMMLFLLYERYPKMIDIKIEKDKHLPVLQSYLRRMEIKKGIFLPIVLLPRSNQNSKTSRIWGLQPYFASGSIRIAEDIPCALELVNEVLRFPRYHHDDILDTMSDQLRNKDGYGEYDSEPIGNFPQEGAPKPGAFQGFDPVTGMPSWGNEDASGPSSLFFHEMTGL